MSPCCTTRSARPPARPWTTSTASASRPTCSSTSRSDEAALRELIGKLEDEPTDLVRRDSFFKEQGLTDADVATVDQVVAVLVEHPRLMQRPVIVKGDRAIIGRPKERVAAFVTG